MASVENRTYIVYDTTNAKNVIIQESEKTNPGPKDVLGF